MKRKFTQLSWLLTRLSILLFIASPISGNAALPDKMSLEQAIQEISAQYDVYFTYNKSLVQEITVDFEATGEKSLEEVMEQVLIGTTLQYRIHDDKYVIIYRSDREGISSLKKMAEHLDELIVLEENRNEESSHAVPALSSMTSLESTHLTNHRMVINISGTVTDQEGEPLIGVNVLVGGTNQGTATDIDGRFILEDVNENATLIFSYIGYQTQEFVLNGRSNISITMISDLQMLDEIVVVGYGTQQRKDITGAITSIDPEEFEDEPVANIAKGLQGKVAGVNVTSGSGSPGGDVIVRIRGNTSVIGGNDPLFVLDGVPMTGSTNLLSSLSLSDIESIEVLKDASATAIYGSRGSNGVILITTKVGKTETSHVDFETSFGYREIENQLDMMNSSQFVEIANERNLNDGLPVVFNDISSLTDVNTNWQDEIFNRGMIQNHSLSFSGGSEKTHYLISGNYFDEDGIIIGSDFKRGSLRFNIDQQISSEFKLSGRFFISRSINNIINDQKILLSALGAPPFFPVRNPDGTYVDAATLKQFPFSPSSLGNPVAIATERLNERTVDRLLGSLTGRYNLTEDLTLKILLGVDNLSAKRDAYIPRILEAGLPAGSGSKSFNSSTSFLNENTINYNRDFGSIHSLDVVGGFTWQTYQTEYLSGSASGFVNDELQNNILDSGENYSAPSNGFSEWLLLSWLGRINYAINDKYLFTLSGRADGSSRFGAGNKWGFFPSGAVAWKVSEENFIKDHLTQLSNLKLRMSYGVSGNQAISPYQSLQRFTGVGLAFGGSPSSGFVADNLGNPDLRWETTEEFNAGLELGFWSQRLRMSLDYYIKNTNDLLARVNLAPSSGFTSTIQNIGSTRNSGIEWQLGADIVSQDNLHWDVNLNAYKNVNVVTETAGGQDIIAPSVNILGSANIVREGEPLSAFFGLRTNGITEDGLIKYVDANNDGEITDADRVVIGSPYPDLHYGISSSLSYGDLSLDVSVVGESGKTLWNNNIQFFMSSFHRGHNQLEAVATQRWTPENPDPSARFPKATNALNQSPSEFYLEDASYLRIQNITLNYDIPVHKLNISSPGSANIYLSIQNLVTFTDYSWYTPDVNTFASGDLRIGVDQRTYPSSRTFMLGLKVGF